MDYKNEFESNCGLNQLLSDELSLIHQHLTSHAIPRSVVNTMDEEFAGHLLHQSCLWGNHELLVDLLSGEQKQYLNATDSKGRTALQAAVCCDSESCARILLENNADPNIGQVNDPQNNILRKNPIHIAAENGNVNIVKLLLQHKADLLAKDGNGFTPMDIAEQNGHTVIMQLLKDAVDDMERARHELFESLSTACSKGNLNEAKDLLNKCGSDAELIVNSTPNGCNTLLFKACQDGHKQIVDLLISKGADGRIHPVTKYSPLYIASYLGRKEIVEILLTHFPNLVNVATVEKWLPIHGAAINNHLNVIDLLLNFDYPKAVLHSFYDKNKRYEYHMPFDINAQDVTGQTVLYVAALVGNQRLIDFLLSFKVSAIRIEKQDSDNSNCDNDSNYDNLNNSNDSNTSPFRRKSAIQKIIDKLSPTSDNVIFVKKSEESSPSKSVSIHPVLLDIYCNNNSETALHASVRRRHYSVASALLSHGANPNLVIHLSGEEKSESDEQFSTTLREAVRNRDASTVDLLIRYGARDDDCLALRVASSNGDNHLMSKILSLKSHPDQEFKINKKALQFKLGGAGVGFVGNVTFSSMFPTTPVMINWHSLKGLSQVRKQWLIDASVAHNIKLKLNIQNQVTAITAITRLDLSNNGLKQVPFCLFQMPSLVVLNLSQNNLQTLPETEEIMSPLEATKSGISRMRKSKSYSSALTSNNSANQPNGWSLPSLLELYLQDNRLECIPKSIFELESLQLIDLSNNKLHSLPYAFWTAPKLREINLSLNLLRDLPVRPNTGSLSLSPLHQNDNKLKNRFKKTDSSIESLSIDEKELSEQDISELDTLSKNLTQKDLNRVNLWSQSVSVMVVAREDESDSRQYCKLVSLNLSHNGFEQIPSMLSCLAINLTRLNMSYNCLKSLGSVKSYPANIKHIDLSHNQISEWFKVNLNEKFNSDAITCFSDSNQCSSPKSSTVSLKNIKLNSCAHRQHTRLDNLKTLILNNNNLTDIVISCEEKESNNDEFEKLDESNHLIKSMKYSKLLFANLSMLDVSNNSIVEISPNISDLTNLSVLNISGNKDICYLPPEMGLLNKLWNLSTRGCNLNEPIKTMIESKKYKTMDIIGYLKSILENAKPYARMKLMIVGIQGIGKTSLLDLLRQEGTGSYKRKPPEHWGRRMGNKNLNIKTPKGVTLSTVGVDVCDWTFEKRIRGQQSFGPVSFRTWDFGGQKEYYATHQYFLSKRSLYLVVWRIIDGERGVDGIFQWLVNIQARAPNSPVIIIGTHYDLVKEYFPSFYAEELQQNIRQRFINVVDPDKCGLPKVIDSIEISIKTKYNIKHLCNIIYDTVFELRCPGSKERLLEQKIPATYLALEDVVSYLAYERRAENKDPVLRAEEYKSAVIGEMMNRYGMTFRDMSELHSATIFLHENGVLLHYEDSTLKDLYFLDPQWLCDMLAHVVTIREINPYARNGIMKMDDLKQLFRLSKCAPTDAQTYLLNLLNKFEVAVTWDSRTLLIPSLLHGEEDLRAGLPGCDVRIPVRSRGWALRKSYASKEQSAPALRIRFKTQSLFEAPKSPAVISVDEIQVSITEPTESMANKENHCSLTVISRPTHSIHRLLLMTYFPSGFWSRLMARVLGDDSVIEIIRSYFKVPPGAQTDPILLSLFNSKAEWLCWQSGFALKHFHTYLIRIKEVFSHLPLGPYDYYNMKFFAQLEGHWKDIQINKSSLLEIYLPNQCLSVETTNTEGITKFYTIEPNQELVAKLLVIIVEHIDTLLEDWYPTLGTRFVHTSEGKFLVTRLVPCSPCLISQLSSLKSNPMGQSTSQQLKSPDDAEWQMIDFFDRNNIKRSIGSSDSHDSGMGRESRDSSAVSSVEGNKKQSTQSCQSYDKNMSEEPIIYSFLVEECILAVYEQKPLVCPIHSKLNTQSIAPDIVFCDLGDHYLIESKRIRTGKLLGRGAFGFVFRAGIKDDEHNLVVDVAMKMLQPVDPGYGARKSDTVAFRAAHNKWERDPMQYSCKAYCTARQELNILLNLKHPNIVPFVGMCTKPLAIILQLAPMGSLDHIIKNYRRSGTQFDILVLQKIILQIAKALEYLHRQRIIYRDLKSENVLVWDLPQPFHPIDDKEGPKVDIKLADYGISRPSLPTGTKGFGGTEGFMAPEIMRYNGEEEYTEKVDCFSFAMFLYELLTLHLPFENQECVKEHILEGGRPPLTQRDLLYPSYFLDLMTLCWAQQPKDRPSISQIVSIISAPEFTHLLDVISLNDNYAVLSANAFKNCDTSLRLILSRIGKQTDLITSNGFCWTDYQTITSLDSITIMSVCLVNDQLWLGDSKASIHVYSVDTFDQICRIELELEDNTPTAIRCMCFVDAFSQVAVSSSSGRLWMCSTVDHSFREIGNNGIPFLCVVNVDNSESNDSDYELWCGQSEGNIAVITLSQSQIKSQHIVSHYEEDTDNRTPISERFDVFQITAHYPYVWTYLYPGCNIWQWDVRKRSILTRLDCSKLAPCSESLMSISIEEHLSPGSCQVTALTIVEDRQELYIGTTWGCIIIAEANTMRPITVFRPYEEDVKAIVCFKPLMNDRLKSISTESLDDTFSRGSIIATIGKGYRSLFNRFLNLDKSKVITQRGLHSILWSTTDWNIN